MLRALHSRFKQLKRDRSGASAIEAAICFPLIIAAAFACFEYGMFFQNSTKVNRSFDKVAREITLLEAPTESQIRSLLQAELGTFWESHVLYTVNIVEQYDSQFARINSVYFYSSKIPFLDRVILRSYNRNYVMLTESFA